MGSTLRMRISGNIAPAQQMPKTKAIPPARSPAGISMGAMGSRPRLPDQQHQSRSHRRSDRRDRKRLNHHDSGNGSVAGSHGTQRGVVGKMIQCQRIKALADHYQPDQQAEKRGGPKADADSRAVHPVVARDVAKFIGGVNIQVGQPLTDLIRQGIDVGIRLRGDKKVVAIRVGNFGETPGGGNIREQVWRGHEPQQAPSFRRDFRTVTVDFDDIANLNVAEFRAVHFIDTDAIAFREIFQIAGDTIRCPQPGLRDHSQ